MLSGAALVKPLDSELRPRSSRLRKEFGTPMPRAALFDRTNECSEVTKLHKVLQLLWRGPLRHPKIPLSHYACLQVGKEGGGSVCDSVTVNTDTETCASEGTFSIVNIVIC